jgi:hypothetical protein
MNALYFSMDIIVMEIETVFRRNGSGQVDSTGNSGHR